MLISREIVGNPSRYRTLVGWSVAIVLGLAGTAVAGDGEPPPQAPRKLPAHADRDGDKLFLGPVGGAISIEGTWDSAVGGELLWLRIRERRSVAAAGVGFGYASYAARDGGRLWLEAVAGTRRMGGWLIGATAGPALELGDVQHPRAGATASVWAFVGVIPYVRAGVLDEAGGFVELGLALELPVWRF